MTLLQRNFVTAKPINFYYLVCKLDRVQYPREQEALINSASVLRETTANGMTKAGLLNYLWK
ncbi:hypothetical protein BHL79_02135 [Limosilactobacillus reuteri]|uniref:hypothetical protein n=1 Tax=Limosilactobacillus reuteri TaxID=1598 RepID=UPI000A2E1AAE|nr:hypothetical protein [Limosilactobacillus reuteri]OTA72697.1 hypothetical protein BHL79_02135 [Limosilactobacillus reuteri]